MASKGAMRSRRRRGVSCSRSRTTSDFEIFRPRDSASMSATRGSGNRTVILFIATSVLHLWRGGKTNGGQTHEISTLKLTADRSPVNAHCVCLFFSELAWLHLLG